MIPLIYVGYAFGVIVIALASVFTYEVTKGVWDAGEDLYEDAKSGSAAIVGGLGLLMLGVLFMSRRK